MATVLDARQILYLSETSAGFLRPVSQAFEREIGPRRLCPACGFYWLIFRSHRFQRNSDSRQQFDNSANILFAHFTTSTMISVFSSLRVLTLT